MQQTLGKDGLRTLQIFKNHNPHEMARWIQDNGGAACRGPEHGMWRAEDWIITPWHNVPNDKSPGYMVTIANEELAMQFAMVWL
jgi:hypothetical protein